MITATRSIVVWVIVACLPGTFAIRAAEDTLTAARDLYGAAAYQEALSMLDRLKIADQTPDAALEIDKYRAFCLFAMGNTRGAEDAMAAMITAHPRFRLNEGEASPRVITAFQEVRRRQLPILIERAYTHGRDAYENKRMDEAIEQFRLVLDLAADPDLPAAQPLAKDMQTLASGFLNLAEATKAAAEAEAKAKAAAAAAAEEAAPPPVPRVTRQYYTPEDSEVVAPVPINQQIPAWPSGLRVVTTTGVVEVIINEKGAVDAATMRLKLNPVFDEMLLEAARSWRYQPAMRGSQPVKYLKRIEINVRAPAFHDEMKEE